MTLLILGIIVLVIIIFLAEAGILVWVEKLFKIENPTYKNSVKTLIFSGIAGTIVGIIFSIINLGLLSDVIITIVSFFTFHYFLKKYYFSTWKKSLGIYVVFGIVGIIVSLVVVIPARLYVFEPFSVSGEAMSPTYNSGDYLLINKFDKDFSRGDVIVFRYPRDPRQLSIKRIIGLPSEKVNIQDGKILINGNVLNEVYINGDTQGDLSITLTQDQYFVLGDNRAMSFDSRGFGPITKSSIQGKIFYKIFGLIVKKTEPVDQHSTLTSTKTTTPISTQISDKTADWKVYNNTQYGFQFKYPPGLDIKTTTVSGPNGSEEHQFYVQGLSGVDFDNPRRLVGVMYPTPFRNNQEKLLSFNQNPTFKASGFTEVEKNFFNLGKAIFHEGSSICGGDYQIIIHESYEFTFFSDAKCSYDPQITEIMNTFKFTK